MLSRISCVWKKEYEEFHVGGIKRGGFLKIFFGHDLHRRHFSTSYVSFMHKRLGRRPLL